MDKLIYLGDGIHVMASQVVSVVLKDAYVGLSDITLTDGRVFSAYQKDIASVINAALSDTSPIERTPS